MDFKRSGSNKSHSTPFFFSIGAYRGFIMDIPEELSLGNKITRIQRPYAQILICQKKEVQSKYIKELEKQIKHHELIEKRHTLKITRLPFHKRGYKNS